MAEQGLSCRAPTADVVLDHPSLSRQHAAVCYNRLSKEWVVLDLDSAHGTKADGKPAPKVSTESALIGLLWLCRWHHSRWLPTLHYGIVAALCWHLCR